MRYSPPSGSTPNILVVLFPLSLMAAATPESSPPPPQHTITTSGSGISSNISRPALQNFTNKKPTIFLDGNSPCHYF